MVRSQETNTNGRTKNIERKRFIFISVLEFEGKIEADHAFGRIGEILISRIGVFVVELLPDEQVGADNGKFKPLENPAAGEQIRKIVADGHRAEFDEIALEKVVTHRVGTVELTHVADPAFEIDGRSRRGVAARIVEHVAVIVILDVAVDHHHGVRRDVRRSFRPVQLPLGSGRELVGPGFDHTGVEV